MNAVVDALVAARHHRHRHAGDARTGVGRDPSVPIGTVPKVRSDPRGVRLRARRLGRRRPSPLLAEHGDDAKLLAGGMSLIPLMKLRLATPSVLVDVGRVARPVVRPRRRRPRRRSARSTRHHDLETSDVLAHGVRRAAGRRRARSATTRCATAARSAARSRTAIRRPTSRRCCSRSTRRSSCEGPGGERDDRRVATSSPASSRPRSRPTSCSPRSGCRRPARTGSTYQKFNRRAQDWAIVGAVAVRANGATHVALVNMGSHAAARDRGRAGARRRARRPTDAAAARGRGHRAAAATSTRRPSTASTSRACSCARALEAV